MWTDKEDKHIVIHLALFLGRIVKRARGRVSFRSLLSLRKWRYLFERIKREINLYRQIQKRDAAASAITETEAYLRANTLRPPIEALLREAVSGFDYKPTISLIMPVYNVDPRWLNAAIGSVLNQIYPYWELCIADDGSTRPETLEALACYGGEPRIKTAYRGENGHICAASNTAAAMATGEFVAFLDNDDMLAPHALFEIVRLLNIHPDADVIYSDEDKIDTEDRHYDLHFKPGWSPVLLLGYNYINHLTCIRRQLFEQVGRFTLGLEGAQDYDLLLRVTERTDRIHHIPKILYHWRAVPESTASAATVKPIVDASAHTAVNNHLRRINNDDAQVYRPEFADLYRLPINQLDWPDAGPAVDIIIFGTDNTKHLANCIASIQSKTTYRNYRISLCTDGNIPANDLPRDVRHADRHTILPHTLNNAVQTSQAELVLFLDGCIQVLESRWLSRLVGYLHLPGVSITGARLTFPDGTLYHAGLLYDASAAGAYAPAFFREPAKLLSYFFLAETARECLAVTSACLLTRRQDFLKHGGFDARFESSGFDVDYCLRHADQGLKTVYVAGAELRYNETRGTEPARHPTDATLLEQRHPGRVDAYHNPNLSPGSFTIGTRCGQDYGELLNKKLKVLFFTHNFNLEGAPKVILNLAAELNGRERIQSLVMSPEEGPAKEFLQTAGVRCDVVPLKDCDNILSGWVDTAGFEAALESIGDFLKKERPDVLVVNVINSFFVVEAAARLGIPCIWIIHESYNRAQLVRAIDTHALPICEQAFAKANSVVFVSQETRRLYTRYNKNLNFTVIHNTLPPTFADTLRTSKTEARQRLAIPANKKVILSVGTVCERKDQKTLVHAIASLAAIREDFLCFIVGARANDVYSEQVRELIEQCGLTQHLRLIPETKDVSQFYAAADIFAFTSLNESYSLTILEAMAFGLPIITTACCGIHEQVEFGANALNFDFHDHGTLARHLATLLDDDEKRISMANHSRSIIQNMPTHDQLLDRYENLILAAWQTGFHG